jgi:hypothetical protein
MDSNMRAKVPIATVLFLSAAVLIAGTGDTTLRPLWASRAYNAKPLPAAWHSKTVARTERDVAAFQAFSSRSLSITNFLATYGLPDRYLVTARRGGQDFLIYDLPSGHSVALYVPKPPAKLFAAIVIIDVRGDLVRLIK